jgi:hypothetical protein
MARLTLNAIVTMQAVQVLQVFGRMFAHQTQLAEDAPHQTPSEPLNAGRHQMDPQEAAWNVPSLGQASELMLAMAGALLAYLSVEPACQGQQKDNFLFRLLLQVELLQVRHYYWTILQAQHTRTAW